MQTRQPPSPAVEPKKPIVFAHHVHRDEHRRLALLVRDALQREQIGMALRGDAADHAMIWRQREVCSLCARCRRFGMREHEPRHAVGERRLADAARPADQPGMRHAASAVGFKKCLFCAGMSVKRERLARMRGGGVIAHEAATIGAAGWSRALTAAQTNSETVAASALALITTQRFGSRSASSR